MLGIVAVGVVKESRKFRAPIYRAKGASRGHLCDSTAFLLLLLLLLLLFNNTHTVSYRDESVVNVKSSYGVDYVELLI